jgi:hypothetical protein
VAKLDEQRHVKALEAKCNRKRRALLGAQDEVDRQREALIGVIEGKLTQTAQLGTLLVIRGSLACQEQYASKRRHSPRCVRALPLNELDRTD